MTFKQYIEKLQEFLKENPETANYKAVYARDAEGNGFDEVYYPPSIGEYEDREWYGADEEGSNPNAVCIN